jgi:general secretion pathway protein G
MRRIHKGQSRGFTLNEMMIVVSFILILVSIALPVYSRSILRAKESVLKQDLFTLRNVIDQYTLDKQKAPQSLDDIVQAGYIKVVPKDPFTNEANWTLDQEDQANAVDQQEPGITDLHSSSSLTATDGTAYSSW